MPIWLQVVCIVAVVVLLSPLIAWADNRRRARAWKRYELWQCPRCGVPFGLQHKQIIWMIRRHRYVRGTPDSGPILHCSHCDADFAFDARGREVDDHREYIALTA